MEFNTTKFKALRCGPNQEFKEIEYKTAEHKTVERKNVVRDL